MESAIRARFVPDSFQNLSRDSEASQIETKRRKRHLLRYGEERSDQTIHISLLPDGLLSRSL
jgi:hypothetical protein